jgi:hypothetical protein
VIQLRFESDQAWSMLITLISSLFELIIPLSFNRTLIFKHRTLVVVGVFVSNMIINGQVSMVIIIEEIEC